MIEIAAWCVFSLGLGHVLTGLVRYRQPFKETVAEGFFGKFQGIDTRRVAFWFTIFGLLVMLSGHVAVHAVADANLALLRIIGIYMLIVSVLGLCAFPKSPFWGILIIAPVLIAGGYGYIA
ncbi:DUF6463 family protein [Janthinobacterium sp.]|uniref:DUF6463 family protein n=1 Tax=Janthinobacterium sp. TaxID=1871054 RepID=UPI00293DA004|nr:DUF6463 family protein [Janthinobacterium sp.]